MISLTKVRPQQDSDRFEQYVREHNTSLYRVAYRLCGDQDDAEDLLQESLLEAYEAFGQFRAGTHFDRWVFRIMRNTYIDRVRKRPKARIDSLDITLDDGRSFGSREIVDLSNVPDLRILACRRNSERL
jgi:RNA polymerase sigma factor (sigma-70 family)